MERGALVVYLEHEIVDFRENMIEIQTICPLPRDKRTTMEQGYSVRDQYRMKN